jgi:hypothetical protein
VDGGIDDAAPFVVYARCYVQLGTSLALGIPEPIACR